MPRGFLLAAVALVVGGYAAAEPIADRSSPQPARLVVLTAGDPIGEKMEFSRKQLAARPGERLRVQLISSGQLPKVAMAHNFVLLKLGSDPQKFADAAAGARSTNFIPSALRGQVIANTDLVGPGERAEVTFTVPKTAGTYPYLCSFAGHYAAGMRGDLIVK